jgi:hypothetical protein
VRTVLARHIFGANVVETLHYHLWDETSLAPRKAFRVYVEDGQRFLDLGAGQAAVLSIYCAMLRDVEALTADGLMVHLDIAVSHKLQDAIAPWSFGFLEPTT